MKGSHNTLTYGKPKHWYGWLLLPFWRCQTKDIAEQVASGIRAFDIRFVMDSPTDCHSAHGIIDLAANPLVALSEIECRAAGSYIRVILERGGQSERAWFCDLCKRLPSLYPTLHFYEGIYKPMWTRIHIFPTEEARMAESNEQQHYGSHYNKWLGLIPRLWWFKHRYDKVDGEENDGIPIVFKDFI